MQMFWLLKIGGLRKYFRDVIYTAETTFAEERKESSTTLHSTGTVSSLSWPSPHRSDLNRPSQHLTMSTLSAPSGRTLGLCAGIGAAAFIGYCIYFDRARRSAPDFKKKLREKRRHAAKRAANNKGPALPDFSDQEAVQKFFLQEVTLSLYLWLELLRLFYSIIEFTKLIFFSYLFSS